MHSNGLYFSVYLYPRSFWPAALNHFGRLLRLICASELRRTIARIGVNYTLFGLVHGATEIPFVRNALEKLKRSTSTPHNSPRPQSSFRSQHKLACRMSLGVWRKR